MVYVGIDLHRKISHLAVFAEDGDLRLDSGRLMPHSPVAGAELMPETSTCEEATVAYTVVDVKEIEGAHGACFAGCVSHSGLLRLA